MVTGLSEARNARELAFTLDETVCFVDALDGNLSDETRAEAAMAVFTRIADQGEKVGSKLWGLLGIERMHEVFAGADASSRAQALLSLANSLNAVQNMVDLTMVGGSKYAGQIHPNYTKLLNDPKTDFYIIDQSVTGMFEKRTRVGL